MIEYECGDLNTRSRGDDLLFPSMLESSGLTRSSRSDFLQVYTLEITLDTDHARKYCLSSEIQPQHVGEVAQNCVLERRISADFRRISGLNQDWKLADGLDIVVGCRTHYVLNGDGI